MMSDCDCSSATTTVGAKNVQSPPHPQLQSTRRRSSTSSSSSSNGAVIKKKMSADDQDGGGGAATAAETDARLNQLFVRVCDNMIHDMLRRFCTGAASAPAAVNGSSSSNLTTAATADEHHRRVEYVYIRGAADGDGNHGGICRFRFATTPVMAAGQHVALQDSDFCDLRRLRWCFSKLNASDRRQLKFVFPPVLRKHEIVEYLKRIISLRQSAVMTGGATMTAVTTTAHKCQLMALITQYMNNVLAPPVYEFIATTTAARPNATGGGMHLNDGTGTTVPCDVKCTVRVHHALCKAQRQHPIAHVAAADLSAEFVDDMIQFLRLSNRTNMMADQAMRQCALDSAGQVVFDPALTGGGGSRQSQAIAPPAAAIPTAQTTAIPIAQPTAQPTAIPTAQTTAIPIAQPTAQTTLEVAAQTPLRRQHHPKSQASIQTRKKEALAAILGSARTSSSKRKSAAAAAVVTNILSMPDMPDLTILAETPRIAQRSICMSGSDLMTANTPTQPPTPADDSGDDDDEMMDVDVVAAATDNTLLSQLQQKQQQQKSMPPPPPVLLPSPPPVRGHHQQKRQQQQTMASVAAQIPNLPATTMDVPAEISMAISAVGRGGGGAAALHQRGGGELDDIDQKFTRLKLDEGTVDRMLSARGLGGPRMNGKAADVAAVAVCDELAQGYRLMHHTFINGQENPYTNRGLTSNPYFQWKMRTASVHDAPFDGKRLQQQQHGDDDDDNDNVFYMSREELCRRHHHQQKSNKTVSK